MKSLSILAIPDTFEGHPIL